MKYICQCCGLSFDYPCRVRPRKYCSRQCYEKSRVQDLQTRFMRKIDRTGECWLWTGARNSDGYGSVNVAGVIKLAHRVAYGLFREPTPDDKQVCHTCDTPACCNPDHLFIGVILDNMQDMAAKDRSCYGERNFHAKLTEKQVLEARSLYATGVHTATELGRMFGVTEQTMSSLLKRKTWKRI